MSVSTYYLSDNTSNCINVNSYAMAFKHEVCKGRRDLCHSAIFRASTYTTCEAGPRTSARDGAARGNDTHLWPFSLKYSDCHHGQDKYRRTLADVYLRDGTNVNYMLVKDGWCWWSRKYAPGDTVLERLEHDARGGRKRV